MTEVTAGQVKSLRKRTGAGMMDCKKALQETGGDMEAAQDWLRTKGLAAAQKKAGRVAAEGLVALAVADGTGSLVEVNSETDFVARNDEFKAFAAKVAPLVAAADGDIENLKAASLPDTDHSVEEELSRLIATIGENLVLRRAACLRVDDGVIGAYVHGAVSPGLGRIGVLVALQSSAEAAALEPLAKQIAMHVAASAPQSVDVGDLDAEVVARERAVLAEQARESGRPDNIVEKMVEGRLRKFYQDAVLLEQTWVHDGESTVAEVLEQAGKSLGAPARVSDFIRFALGEGVEKAG